jgi:hypothetical protein
MEKVGRNDPCPCGSGKKYKKCCEAKQSRKGLSERKVENRTNTGGLSHLFKPHLPSQTVTTLPPVSEIPPDPEAPSDSETPPENS